MNKNTIILLLFLLSFELSGQFDITVRGGGLVDMYKIEKDYEDNVFSHWPNNVRKGEPWDYPYLNLEIAYYITEKDIVGLRYHFEEFMEQICFNNSTGGTSCDQVNEDNILKISSHYKRIFPLSSKISFQPSLGLGVSFTYYDGYLDESMNLVGTGDGRDGDVKYFEYSYLDHKIIPFIPLEINLNFKFNKFLYFELNIGYNQYLRKSIIRTEIFYKVGDSEERRATIYTANSMYIGLGIGYHINFRKKNK